MRVPRSGERRRVHLPRLPARASRSREDSVGAHVSIDHLAATPLGLKVVIEAKIVEMDRRRVTFEFTVTDPIEPCGRGRHVRFVVETAQEPRAPRGKARQKPASNEIAGGRAGAGHRHGERHRPRHGCGAQGRGRASPRR